MAKRARAKKLGLLGLLGKAVMGFARAFDGSAGWVAEHVGNPRPANQRRASLEWTSKGERGSEHLPATPIGIRWHGKHTAKDKEIWRAIFSPGGLVHEFETWPPRDYAEALAMARESVVKQHGVFAQSWECSLVEFVRKVVEEAEDIEA